LRIADFVTVSFTPGQRAALLDSLARTEVLKAGHSRDKWAMARYPCAFLEDSMCSIHAARPFACRGYNSLDANRCHVRQGNPCERTAVPEFAAQRRVAELFRDGIRLAVAEKCLIGDVVELVPAVRIALTTPFAAKRWLAGEALFADAVCTLPESGWGED